MADTIAEGENSQGSLAKTSIRKMLAMTDLARWWRQCGGQGGGAWWAQGRRVQRHRGEAVESGGVGWHLYDLCTYFVETALIPIVFLIACRILGLVGSVTDAGQRRGGSGSVVEVLTTPMIVLSLERVYSI
ncbi:hypothetical protein NL676_007115 [Syzygium grande]|nr:hypothetical protein NL676_007115 [Syzygium grande]